MKRVCKTFFLIIFLTISYSAAANLNFSATPLLAGKRVISDNSLSYSVTFGVAKFAPQGQLPLILTYCSKYEKNGILGGAWSIPLIERSVSGNIWTTPWGEVIDLKNNNHRFKKVDRVICGVNEYKGYKKQLVSFYANGSISRICN